MEDSMDNKIEEMPMERAVDIFGEYNEQVNCR
jgi:hypothetical protein